MGSGKKEAARRERQGKTGEGLGNVKVKGENFYRSAKKVKTLNMFKDGKAQRNAAGKITQAAKFQSRETPNARIEPNRKWFNNSRVIAQDSLAQFREAVAKTQSDPYSYLLKQNKIPMSLIRDDTTKNGLKQHQAKMAVETRPFSDTFGPKAQRKRVKLDVSSAEDLAGLRQKMHDDYLKRQQEVALLNGQSSELESDLQSLSEQGTVSTAREAIFSKGQSKRIYNELYKVIDSSDVVIHVLDARDPEGTRCRGVLEYMAKETPHKHILFVLNKCDLIPTSLAAKWVKLLGKEHPTIAFRSSLTNSFGKGSLIQVLRQFSTLHSNRKQISVGLIGYPNTGKSSVINALKGKSVCQVAPIPGATKIWQYITLMKRIYLIDCPGIVPPNQNDTEEDILLRGAVRIEKIEYPQQYIAAVLKRCQERHVRRTYGIEAFHGSYQFLDFLARKTGKLLKGGEPDVESVAKMVLNDFLRGKLPWYVAPAVAELALEDRDTSKAKTGDVLKLNKAPTTDLRSKKRKRQNCASASSEEFEEVEKAGSNLDFEEAADKDNDVSVQPTSLEEEFSDSGEDEVSQSTGHESE